MKLFHVSEEENITKFVPRNPSRKDLDQSKALVWAITEECLPNFLTPRNCPRVTYHCNNATTEEDKRTYFSSQSSTHVIAIEHKWFDIMVNTNLYLYEFDPTDFYLLDKGAGYYVSEKTQLPINKYVITDLFGELINRNVEIRIIANLWDLCDAIQHTSFDWSMCRMGYAKTRDS